MTEPLPPEAIHIINAFMAKAPASDEETAAVLGWVAEFTEAMAPYVNGAYVNVPNAGMPDWERAYWGADVDRLRKIKAAYDPACRALMP